MPIEGQLIIDFGDGGKRTTVTASPAIDREFPQSAASELGRAESYNKHLYRPNTYLHKWWARRAGTTFRYILKQLVDVPWKRDFYEAGGLEGKVVLDPMMGGGTTLHEAIRMGANVIGVDIDPIPVLQARASLEFVPVRHKVKVFEKFYRALRVALEHLYATRCPACREVGEVQFVLYGLRRRCSCREVLVVDDLLLRENGQGPSVYICASCGKVYSGLAGKCGCGCSEMRILVKSESQCGICHSRFEDLVELPFRSRYQPVAIVGLCRHDGRFFKTPEKEDMELLVESETRRGELNLGTEKEFLVPKGPKSRDLHNRNVTDFQELFTSRQLMYLNVCNGLLKAFEPKDRLWLALLVSTSLEFNSLLCGYKGVGRRRPGAIRHVFSHHAYSFPYTALENNPVFRERASGTLQRLFFDRVIRAGRWAALPKERNLRRGEPSWVSIEGEVDGGHVVGGLEELDGGIRKFHVVQESATSLSLPDGSVDFVVTDPPYYDSVQYGDLSNFFRVWLRWFLPDQADWSYDEGLAAVSTGDRGESGRYVRVLGQIWQECARVLKGEGGRLVFTYHHWRAEAWATLAISLRKGGLSLVNRYVVFSENPSSVHIRGMRSLKHDVVLILASAVERSVHRRWEVPRTVDTTDSEKFCRDCGGALGWFVASDLPDSEIRRKWRRLIEEGEGG